MNKYRVWVDGKKERTIQFVEANTSFFARQHIASRHNVKSIECISQRVYTDIVNGKEYILANHQRVYI